MKIIVNGQQREIEDNATVQSLLAVYHLTHERVAVECNGHILARDDFPSHRLQEGDVLEVVRFVGGG